MSGASETRRRLRAVVCGTTFGRFYLAAFRHPACPFELRGIVANGSARSRALSERHGVPLFDDPARVPADTDVACVVVRSAVFGGQGTELAKAFMARGVHVVQEHPIHGEELADCLRHAHRHGVVYHLNTFYGHVAPVRYFIATARRLLRERPPLFIDAACAIQVAYSLFDVLGAVLDRVTPCGIATPLPLPEEARLGDARGPFRSLEGVMGGVPLTLRIQNQIDPSDPDNHVHLLHRVTIGTESGSLTLLDTHGPIVWSRRLHVPEASKALGDVSPIGAADFAGASAELVGPAVAPSYRRILGTIWPDAVCHALRELDQAVRAGTDPRPRGQRQLTLCRLWQEATTQLGYPELVQGAPPRPLSVVDFAPPFATFEEPVVAW